MLLYSPSTSRMLLVAAPRPFQPKPLQPRVILWLLVSLSGLGTATPSSWGWVHPVPPGTAPSVFPALEELWSPCRPHYPDPALCRVSDLSLFPTPARGVPQTHGCVYPAFGSAWVQMIPSQEPAQLLGLVITRTGSCFLLQFCSIFFFFL